MKKLFDDYYLSVLLLLSLWGGDDLSSRYGLLNEQGLLTQDSIMGESFAITQRDSYDPLYALPSKRGFGTMPFRDFPVLTRNGLNIVNTWLVTDGGVVAPERPSNGSDSVVENAASAPVANNGNRTSGRSMAEIVFPGSDLSDEDMDLIDILWKQDIDMGVGREVYDPNLRREMDLKAEQKQQQGQAPQLHHVKEEAPNWAVNDGRKIDPETGEFLLPADFFEPTKTPAPAPMAPAPPTNGYQQAPFTGEGSITHGSLLRAFEEMGMPNGNNSSTEVEFKPPMPVYGNGTGNRSNVGPFVPAQHPALLSQQSVEQTLNNLYEFRAAENTSVPEPVINNVEQIPGMMLDDPESFALSSNGTSLESALIQNTSFNQAQPNVLPNQPFSFEDDLYSNLSSRDLPLPSVEEENQQWFNTNQSLNISRHAERSIPLSNNSEVGGFLQDLFNDPSEFSLDPETGEPTGNLSNFLDSADDIASLSMGAGASGTNPSNNSLWDNRSASTSSSGSRDPLDSFYDSSPSWQSYSNGPDDLKSEKMNYTSGESDYNETSDYGGSSTNDLDQGTGRDAFLNFNAPRRFHQGLAGSMRNVRHNHTYTAPPGGVPHVRKMDLKASKSHKGLSRDERNLMELGIPLTVSQIVSSAVEEFNDILRAHNLSPAQLQAIRDIRRRGKNKVAAQNCRRRRLGAVLDIGDRVVNLRQERDMLQKESESLGSALLAAKGQLAGLAREVFASLRDDRGRPYNPSEYSLEVGPDGAAVLVRVNDGITRRKGVKEAAR